MADGRGAPDLVHRNLPAVDVAPPAEDTAAIAASRSSAWLNSQSAARSTLPLHACTA